MQNRYAGDVGDFGKFGLLLALTTMLERDTRSVDATENLPAEDRCLLRCSFDAFIKGRS